MADDLLAALQASFERARVERERRPAPPAPSLETDTLEDRHEQ